MDLKIFVVIVTYKGKQWYDRCFTSLRESTIPVQTVVVDNASGDGTVEYIEQNYPEIHLIESRENLGFGKGNNLGLKYAYAHGCDFVFLLNQDAWLDSPDTLEQLVGLAMKHPEFGVLSPMHISVDKSALCTVMEYGGNRYTYQMLSDFYFGVVKDVYETNYVNAAAWLLPRKTLSILGGFDPLIFHYGEDDDYLNRARYHGLKIGVCPSPQIIHDHRKTGVLLEMSNDFARKSAVDDLELFLDLNRPFDYRGLRRHYLQKYIKSLLSGNANEKKQAMYKYKYLKRMRASIEFSREMNKIKQPNWIQ